MTSNEPSHSPDKLDILIDQVGHFTEGLTELRILVQAQAETAQKQLEAIDKQGERIEQLAKSFEEQRQSIDRIADAMEASNRSQSEQRQSIDRIANAMEASNRSQSEAINRLAAIVDRLLPPEP